MAQVQYFTPQSTKDENANDNFSQLTSIIEQLISEVDRLEKLLEAK